MREQLSSASVSAANTRLGLPDGCVPARQVLCDRDEIPPDQFQAVEDAFFRGLRMPNGTYKTTERGRLNDLNTALVSVLEASRKHQSVLDVGASSGVTSVDLADALSGISDSVEVIAMDLFVNASIRQLGNLELLLDDQNRALQICVSGKARVRPHSRGHGSAGRVLARIAFGLADVFARFLPMTETRVSLISRLAREDSRVQMVEQDLFQSRADWYGRFDLIRAANILNRDYFSSSELKRAVSLQFSYLKDAGFLVIARKNADNELNATILRKASGRLRVVRRIGQGSEIEALAIEALRDLERFDLERV